MKNVVRTISIDCSDPYRLAEFWCQVFGVPMYEDDNPGDPEAVVLLEDGQAALLMTRVPEAKSVKNRAHLDLEPATTRDEEIERLLALGATAVDDRRRPDGSGWMVFVDPEGNEFCVGRSAAERAAQS